MAVGRGFFRRVSKHVMSLTRWMQAEFGTLSPRSCRACLPICLVSQGLRGWFPSSGCVTMLSISWQPWEPDAERHIGQQPPQASVVVRYGRRCSATYFPASVYLHSVWVEMWRETSYGALHVREDVTKNTLSTSEPLTIT